MLLCVLDFFLDFVFLAFSMEILMLAPVPSTLHFLIALTIYEVVSHIESAVTILADAFFDFSSGCAGATALVLVVVLVLSGQFLEIWPSFPHQ